MAFKHWLALGGLVVVAAVPFHAQAQRLDAKQYSSQLLLPRPIWEANGEVNVHPGGSARARLGQQAQPRNLGSSVVGDIATVAGNGQSGYSGNGGPATSAELNRPYGVAIDASGNLYIADNLNSVVRKVTPAGIVTTVAGTQADLNGDNGNGGPATSAAIDYPVALAFDASGNLYIADYYSVRKVTPAGIISAFAGGLTQNYGGEGGPATSAGLLFPSGIAFDGLGNLYLSDPYNDVIDMVNTSGILTTVAGNTNQGYSGDGQVAGNAELNGPAGVAVDPRGNIYFADNGNNVIRFVSTGGIISTVAGNGNAGYSGDGGPATSAQLNGPYGLALDLSGNLYIADSNNNVIRKVTPGGVISTVAGDGSGGYSGDAGPATSAALNAPTGVALDGSGNLYIADSGNNVIREVTYTSGAPTAASPTFSPAAGSYTSAQNVTLSDTTSGATIYYTTNGTTPTTASTKYSGPITVSATETIEAIAVATGDANSTVVSAAYTIAIPTTTTVSSSANPQTLGMAITFTATVKPASGTTEPAGTLTFKVDGKSTSTPALNGSGQATYVTSTLTAGTHTVVASYGGGGSLAASTSATLTQTITSPVASGPIFSPAFGTYSTAQTVTLSDTTTGATIYYTTNGATPTAASTRYTGAITVSATEAIEAIAVATGYSNSAVSTGTYTIANQTATPVFSVAPGTYTSTQTVTLSDTTTGATIYYTTNGTTPTAASTKYTGPITVSTTETIEAIAVATGDTSSAVASAAYTIPIPTTTTITSSANPQTAGMAITFTATVTPASGTAVPTGTVNFTLYGTTVASPALNSSGQATYVTSTIPVGNHIVFANYAGSGSFAASTSAALAQTITSPAASGPLFSPAAGTYSTAQTVTLMDTTPGVTIYYTTNGTTPTAASTRYTGAISVSATETIEAIAVATGYTNSPVSTGTYTIGAPTAATPVFSVAPGTYTSTQTVALSDTTHGATIYYTTNGATPTAASTKYTGAITVSTTETIAAISVATGYTNSAVATAAYTITPPAAATPVFSIAAGTYTSAQTVTLSDATTGATIYYTTNGTTPTTASTRYTGAISVLATETLEAVAIASNYSNSAVAKAVYTINLPVAATPTVSQTITLAEATANTTLYYTTDGTVPTAASTRYIGPITLTAGSTLKFIAIGPNLTASAVRTVTTTIQ